jgi:hypothetical protein
MVVTTRWWLEVYVLRKVVVGLFLADVVVVEEWLVVDEWELDFDEDLVLLVVDVGLMLEVEDLLVLEDFVDDEVVLLVELALVELEVGFTELDVVLVVEWLDEVVLTFVEEEELVFFDELDEDVFEDDEVLVEEWLLVLEAATHCPVTEGTASSPEVIGMTLVPQFAPWAMWILKLSWSTNEISIVKSWRISKRELLSWSTSASRYDNLQKSLKLLSTGVQPAM